ncbi:uncharacterized protein LOC131927832 [Physella acuta]|uniref:uncharacterized protein LOC131927832 n=1 Tax=Physella acuta TaxID=109671 RepID=UPI0027DDEDF5|nr:uncharacterized protein LOC131927832 [Physella acuta]
MKRKLVVNLILIIVYSVYLKFIKPTPETKICTTFHGPNNYTRYQCEQVCCGSIGERHCCSSYHLYFYDVLVAGYSKCVGLECLYRLTMGLYAACVLALDFFWFTMATRPRIVLPQRLLRPMVPQVVVPPTRRTTSVGNKYFPRTSGGDDSVLM